MTAAEPHILAIDLGTSGCKVGLVSLTGKVAGWAFRPVQLMVVDKVGAEQNPEDWWTAFLEAAREVLGQDAAPASSIAGICCSLDLEVRLIADRRFHLAPHLELRLFEDDGRIRSHSLRQPHT